MALKYAGQGIASIFTRRVSRRPGLFQKPQERPTATDDSLFGGGRSLGIGTFGEIFKRDREARYGN